MSDVYVATPEVVAARDAPAQNRAAHEPLADLTRAVQGALEAEPDVAMLVGMCLCVPQAGDHEQGACLLLLATHAGDQPSTKLVEMDDVASADARHALSNLLDAMQRALVGETNGHIAHGGTQRAGHIAGANGTLPHQHLSERELQVVRMLSNGQTVGAISKDLNLSVKTVSTYRVRALKKMNFKTNAELIRYMIQHKLG